MIGNALKESGLLINFQFFVLVIETNTNSMKKIFISALVSLSLVSCGGGGNAETDSSPKPSPAPAPAKMEIPQSVDLLIEGNDQMKFNLSSLEVYEGQTVNLTLKHVGELPLESMGHNWVLLAKGVDKADFASAAIAAKENGYIPQDRSADIIAHTETIGGGAETTIQFTAPAAGNYDYICSFPGHYGLMNGILKVKKP